jgi:hypothetical protein
MFSLMCRIWEEEKDMKVKGGLLGIWKGKGGRSGWREKVMGGEYDQSTLYACMERS